jgi:light-regulated signal transduction histidine kinase (bacteriophytochrome)
MKEALREVEAANAALKEAAAAKAQLMSELELKNQELEAFSYSVSHDLRAPLRTVDGFSHMLAEALGDGLDGEAAEYLARIRRASKRMGQLIEDLLDLAKVGRHEMTRESVDFSALAATVIESLRVSAPGRSVDAVIHAGVRCEADRRLLRIVLENLCGNAWKFTSKVAKARIEIGCAPVEQGAATYFVRDNGAGFDASYAERLFAPFQRLHKETEFPGTGIGLATVQRIIRRHGGRIWAEARVDGGATFYFTLSAA